METYAQRIYEVRYPDGETAQIQAHQMFTVDGVIGLRKSPVDGPGNTLFMAAPGSGVTIRLLGEAPAVVPTNQMLPHPDDDDGRLIPPHEHNFIGDEDTCTYLGCRTTWRELLAAERRQREGQA